MEIKITTNQSEKNNPMLWNDDFVLGSQFPTLEVFYTTTSLGFKIDTILVSSKAWMNTIKNYFEFWTKPYCTGRETLAEEEERVA